MAETGRARAVMAMAATPRDRGQTLGDLERLVLAPLLHDRIAVATRKAKEGEAGGVAGIAIWATLTEEAEARLKEQIAEKVFPPRLKPEDWAGGDRVWLLDLLSPDRALASAVLANLRQVTGKDTMALHPVAAEQLDRELLARMGVARAAEDGT
jgi:hemolysin-activating ACP:hemolysin acyltransferase